MQNANVFCTALLFVIPGPDLQNRKILFSQWSPAQKVHIEQRHDYKDICSRGQQERSYAQVHIQLKQGGRDHRIDGRRRRCRHQHELQRQHAQDTPVILAGLYEIQLIPDRDQGNPGPHMDKIRKCLRQDDWPKTLRPGSGWG